MATAPAPKRVLGYVRLSRAYREESTSVARQRQVIEQTCEARGWALVGILEDVDVSATRTRLDRPGLNEARRRIAAGEADALLVWKLDRVARSVVDFGTLLDEGLDIISATEPLDTTTPMGRAMAEVLQVFARLEAKTIGARIASSQRYLREETTRWAGGVRPYGYRVVDHPDGVGKALAIDPEEGAVVRRMVDMVLLEGRSAFGVAQALNADGVKPRRADQWQPVSVRKVLTADASLGRVRSQGRLVLDADGVPEVRWEPLLTLEERDRLRRVLEREPSGRSGLPKGKRASRLLSGMLSCAGCGAPLVVRRRKGDALYGCSAAARGKACPRGTVIQAEPVEAEVAARFLEVWGPFAHYEETVTYPDAPGRAEVEEAIAATTDAMREPGADIPALVERLQTLQARRDDLGDAPVEPEVVLAPTGRTIAQTWDAEDVAGRRALLAMVGTRVALGPGQKGRWRPERVQVAFQGPQV